jgi:hypothetical protein
MISISSPDHEDLVVKWLLAEAIRYRNSNFPITNAYGLKWATKTRMQKILFSVIDEFDLPITRSWYMWGGFVHSDILANETYTSFRHDYSKNPDRALRFRKKANELGLPTEDILKSLEKHVDEIQTMPSKIFLLRYYDREAPKDYRELYISKQIISNFLDDLREMNPENQRSTCKKINQIGDIISQFHISTASLFDDERIEKIKIRFAGLVETALDKLDFLVQDKQKIPLWWLSFFGRAKNTFDNFIWSSYACKVSQRTIVGIRAKAEQKKMKIREKQRISQSSEKLNELESELKNKKLEFSWDELQKYKKIVYKESDTARILSEIIGIYSRADSRE